MIKGKQFYESKGGVLPKNIIFKHTSYDITYCHPGYIVKKYFIVVNNKQDRIIENIIIADSFHPNAWGHEGQKNIYIDNPPKFSRFCTGDSVIGAKLISDSLLEIYQNDCSVRPSYNFYSDKYIRYMISQWGLDDPHHFPPREYVKTIPPLPKEIK